MPTPIISPRECRDGVVWLCRMPSEHWIACAPQWMASTTSCWNCCSAARNWALEIGAAKRAQGLPPEAFHSPAREQAVLRRLGAAALGGALPPGEVATVFHAIMAASLRLQRPLSVAFLGPAGTFSEEASITYFGADASSHPCATIAEVFRAVAAEEVDYGLVPMENSTGGIVAATLDNLRESTVLIQGELRLPVRLHLLAAAADGSEAPRRIAGHSQALSQCRRWLDQHWPGVPQQAVESSGEAARCALGEPGLFAVAGALAERRHQLRAVARNIHDEADNTTRFVSLGRRPVPVSGRDRSSILLTLRDRSGALRDALSPFADAAVSLSHLSSHPWQSSYIFLLEFEGHRDDPAVAAMLNAVERCSALMKVLGSYPQAAA